MSNSSDPQDSKVSKVIPATSQVTYERWEVPSEKRVKQHTLEKAGLTARQLEAIQQQAYDEGFQLGKSEGHEQGLQEGHKEGHQQGILNAQEEIAQIVKSFEQVMNLLARPVKQVSQIVEEELVHLSMATAKQIIRREIQTNPGQIIAVIKDALSALPSNSKKIKVYLHPLDAQIVRDNLLGNTDEYDEETWSVIDEPNITRGGCQIKSESSQIDASIDTRIAEISARLLGDERAGSSDATNVPDELTVDYELENTNSENTHSEKKND